MLIFARRNKGGDDTPRGVKDKISSLCLSLSWIFSSVHFVSWLILRPDAPGSHFCLCPLSLLAKLSERSRIFFAVRGSSQRLRGNLFPSCAAKCVSLKIYTCWRGRGGGYIPRLNRLYRTFSYIYTYNLSACAMLCELYPIWLVKRAIHSLSLCKRSLPSLFEWNKDKII